MALALNGCGITVYVSCGSTYSACKKLLSLQQFELQNEGRQHRGDRGGDRPLNVEVGGRSPPKFAQPTHCTRTCSLHNPYGIVVTRTFDGKTGTIRRTIRTGT